MIEHVLLDSDVLLSMLFLIQLLDLIVTVDFRAYIDAQRTLIIQYTSIIVWWMGWITIFLCNPMHTLLSSGYTLSWIYIDDFISLIYTIPHTNSWVSAGVHTLAKKSCFSSLFGSHPPD